MMNVAQPLWLVILSLSLTGSIIGAVVPAVASALNDRSRRRFELQKWRADFYLRPKLEALRNLHAAMVRSHYGISMRAKAGMQTVQEYLEQIKRPEMEFFEALTKAEIYLDSDTSKFLHAVLGRVRQMSTSIECRLPENVEKYGKEPDAARREPEWQPFSSSFDAAEAQLRSLLHPNKLLEAIEK